MNTLSKIVSADLQFGEAAQRVLEDESTIVEESLMIAASRVIRVVEGQAEVGDLREDVARANILSRETIGLGDQLDEDTTIELLARRIFHGSARRAINCVKSERRLTIMFAKHAEFKRKAERRLIDESSEVLRAYRTQSLVQYMMKEGK